MNINMTLNSAAGAKRVRRVTDAELARFLLGLSDLYRDEKTGNPGLSLALEELAQSLVKRKSSSQRPSSAIDHSIQEALRNADFATLNDLLNDDGLTKSDLMQVARERFGIPKSRLSRLNREDVKSELKSAMLHEESLKIIAQEAKRGGTNRVS